jgi:hypothetical protein
MRGRVASTSAAGPSPGSEVEVALVRFAEVRLLEDERHPERALPEDQSRLPLLRSKRAIQL